MSGDLSDRGAPLEPLPTGALLALRFTGDHAALTADARTRLLQRTASQDPAVAEAVARLIARVRIEGDAALFAFAQEFDHVTLTQLEVPRAAVTGAALVAGHVSPFGVSWTVGAARVGALR